MPFNNLKFVKIHTELKKKRGMGIYKKDAVGYINIPLLRKWLQNVKECILQKDKERLCSWDIAIKQ